METMRFFMLTTLRAGFGTVNRKKGRRRKAEKTTEDTESTEREEMGIRIHEGAQKAQGHTGGVME